MPALPQGWRASFRELLDAASGAAPPSSDSGAASAWPELRRFTMRARTAESQDVTSFELSPQDQVELAPYLPGQYVSVTVPDATQDDDDAAAGSLTASYSLSQAPRPDRLRISVKRPRVGSAGRRLHDQLDVGGHVLLAAPRGTFTLDATAPGPVVLLSAGVGVTPLLAMLDALVQLRRRPSAVATPASSCTARVPIAPLRATCRLTVEGARL